MKFLSLIFVTLLLQACISVQSRYEIYNSRDYLPSHFAGSFVPQRALNAIQQKTFGSKITITDYAPKAAVLHLLNPGQKFETTNPSLKVELYRELDDVHMSTSSAKYYYLGINKLPISMVHYDFDDQHIAFEETTTTLKKNHLVHRREVKLYNKSDPSKKTQSAGLTISHHYKLFGNLMVVSHVVEKLEKPWIDVFPPKHHEKIGVTSATYVRVEKARVNAKRGHDLNR